MSRGYLEGKEKPESRIRNIADKAEWYLKDMAKTKSDQSKFDGFADKFYDYMSRGYYSLASPVWANYGKNRGLPVSCFGSYIDYNMEAILFGHEKGAFTGASNANKGIFRAADKGTLLLDEISEMPLSLQAKLLRVLQERKVTPLGGQRDIEVDVRVLATSNRDMASEVRASRFREDLYYRLNVFPLQTQNLSSRQDDILPIAIKILDKHKKQNGNIPFVTLEARDLLLNHSWPGNVRELENTLQRALVLSDNSTITASSIMIDKSLSNVNETSSIETLADQLAFARATY